MKILELNTFFFISYNIAVLTGMKNRCNSRSDMITNMSIYDKYPSKNTSHISSKVTLAQGYVCK